MWEDNAAAISEGIIEGDGWVEILPDEEIAVIECRSDDLEEYFVRLRNRRNNDIQSESMIVLRGGNSDGFGHREGALSQGILVERIGMHCTRMWAPMVKVREEKSAVDGHAVA